MKRKMVIVLLLPLFFATNCASIFSGTKEQVSISSNEDGSTIYVNDVEIGKDSAVTVFSKKKDYRIKVSKKGCRDAVAIPTRSIDGNTFLGILLDLGIVSILVVDTLITGAVQEFDQNVYIVTPNCSK